MCGGGESMGAQQPKGSRPNGAARPPAPQPGQAPRGNRPNGMARPAPSVQPMQPVAKTRIGSAIEMGGR